MKKIPEHFKPVDNCFINTFCRNGGIDYDLCRQIANAELYAEYPTSGDWWGRVWFQDGKFHCMVQRFGSHVGTESHEDPTELQEILFSKYGKGKK